MNIHLLLLEDAMYFPTALEALAHARASELDSKHELIRHRREVAHILRIERLQRALVRAQREFAAVRTALTSAG
ncbi:MAG: hypothetical protein IPG47_14760 [Thermoflexaceae bacterium]|nr:hypothetical protein [Thermoflexaceae bacterium]